MKFLVSCADFKHEIECGGADEAALGVFRVYEIPELLSWVVRIQEWNEEKKKWWKARYKYTGFVLDDLGIAYVELSRPSRIKITGGAVEKVNKA